MLRQHPFLYAGKKYYSRILNRIMKISPAGINFCANYVNSTTVRKWDDERWVYDTINANLVKYDRMNENDFIAVSSLETPWRNSDFIMRLVRTAKDLRQEFRSVYGTDLYILTSQTDNFDNLEPDKILGLAEISEWSRRVVNLNFLQARPNNLEYKRIGSGILDCIKEKYDKILLSAAEGTDEFYKKNGFVRQSEFEGRYVWKRPIIDRIKRLFQHKEVIDA